MPTDADCRDGRQGASPDGEPLATSPEARERDAAHRRAGDLNAETTPLCIPDVPGLDSRLIFSLLAENVRDYAIFLLDPDGVIQCWGEGARLMKWWTRPQAEGGHLRMLYPPGGSEDGTAEAHLAAAVESGEYSGEGHRVRSDGSLFWAYVTLTALRDPDGALRGFAKVTITPSSMPSPARRPTCRTGATRHASARFC